MPLNRLSTTILPFLILLFFTNVALSQEYRYGKTMPAIPYGHQVIAPPGMVYVPGGVTLINYDQSTIDTNSIKKVSVTSFFMSKTETTNVEYRTFVNWVIDSIAIVKYLKDEKYFKPLKTSKTGESTASSSTASSAPVTPPVTTGTDSMKAGDTTKTAMAAAPAAVAPDTSDFSKRRIDWTRVDHDKIWNSNNEDIKAKLAPMLDENGNIRKDMYVFNYKYRKMVSSTTHNGKDVEVVMPINVYPDENCWAEDLTNATTDMYVENYFKATAFNDYPVVGVSWYQARAYCYWLSMTAEPYYNMPEYMHSYRMTYNLPSEAQWVYAAQGYYEMIFPEDSTAQEKEDTSTGPLVATDSASTIVLPSDSMAVPHDSAWVAAQIHKVYYDDSIKKAMRMHQASEEQKSDVHVEKPKAKKPIDPNLYVMDYIKMLYFFNHRYNGSFDTTRAIDSTAIHRDPNGMLMNFKQNEGDYWEDGAALTTPVMSFAPNEYGIYNMEGNVSEWTLDAYSPSAYSFVSDLNPALMYDADSTDADVMKRKVVRGGSFMGAASMLSPFYRDIELQNLSHCYLGFRTVMLAPEVIRKSTETRSRTIRGKKTKGKFNGVRLPDIHE